MGDSGENCAPLHHTISGRIAVPRMKAIGANFATYPPISYAKLLKVSASDGATRVEREAVEYEGKFWIILGWQDFLV